MLRLIADDLTGALDSAARFVPLFGPIPVTWGGNALGGSAAIDSGSRECDESAAVARVAELLPLLASGGIAFKKIDSLLRGHVAAELAVCMRSFDHCVLAPAFPFQGRVTRGGRQLLRDGAGWRDTGRDLQAELRVRGVSVEVRDADGDADLSAIVEHGRSLPGRVLWCGTGGLAGALAGGLPVPCPELPRPVLALIGSDHPVSVLQLNAATSCLHRIAQADASAVAGIGAALRMGAAAVCVDVARGASRREAKSVIETTFSTLLRHVEKPGTLLVTGGETLRGLCRVLGVEQLDVDGEVMPGVPTSRLRGGTWEGQRLVSKSGAFGHPALLAELLGLG